MLVWLLLMLLAWPVWAGDMTGALVTPDGRTRTYLVHESDFKRVFAPALVFVMHGGYNGKASGMVGVTGWQFSKLADKTGAIIVYPQGVDGWADGRGVTGADEQNVDDVGFLLALRDQLREEKGTGDTFATGISNGAFMSARLACDAPPNAVQGIGEVVGTYGVGVECPRLAALPYLLVMGSGDPIIAYDGGRNVGEYVGAEVQVTFWASRNGCANPAKLPAELRGPAWNGLRLSRFTYEGCAAPTVFLRVNGGGHVWDGSLALQYAPAFLVGPVFRGTDPGTGQTVDLAAAMWDVWH